MSAVAEVLAPVVPDQGQTARLATMDDIKRLIDERISPNHVVGDVNWCNDENEWRALVASDAGALLLMAFKITLRGHRN